MRDACAGADRLGRAHVFAVRCLMNSARTSRYMPVQPASPRISTTVPMPRPNTAANAKISRMSGIEVKTL